MEINNELLRSLGMALVHSLWEGLIILVLILFALSLAGRTNARLRYIMMISGHFLLLAAFLGTWYIIYNHNIASSLTPLTKAYSNVNGLVSSSSIVVRTADYTSTLNQFLEPLYPALAAGWIMGFIFMAIRMAGGFYLSYTIIRKDILHPDPTLAALFERAKTSLVMPVNASLRMSARHISPMVIGILKPCVIVPAAILSGLNTQQVESILVHELAHIRRYDHIVMIVQAIITQILFFHPVAWYFSAGINRERENCCDDLVIKTIPNPIIYIKALTMIQEMNVETQVPANAFLGRSKRLLGRVKRLLKTEKRHSPVFRMAGVLLLIMTLGIAAITIVSAGNPGTNTSIVSFFSTKKDKSQPVTDTLKIKKHGMAISGEENGNKDDLRKQEQLDEAARKLEKAHQEMQKAQLELEKAREEFKRAGGQMQPHDLAILSQEHAKHFMMEDQLREFKLNHEKASDEQRKGMELQRRAMEDHMRLSNEAMRGRMWELRPEKWNHDMKEWEKAGKEMDKAGKEFYKAWKDSDKIWVHPPIPMNTPPAAPLPPGAPSPDIIMEIPGPEINLEIPEPLIVAPPEPVVPLELMKEEEVQPEKENTKPLDSRLKELEGE